jgi:protein-disulfide isomerase
MNITFVKKIKADGSPCRKCAEVQSRLEKEAYIDKIDRTVIADERDINSEGMQLARQYSVDRAPFFIVENEGKEPLVYTVYFKFVNDVLNSETSEEDAAKDILDSNPDLDFL